MRGSRCEAAKSSSIAIFTGKREVDAAQELVGCQHARRVLSWCAHRGGWRRGLLSRRRRSSAHGTTQRRGGLRWGERGCDDRDARGPSDSLFVSDAGRDLSRYRARGRLIHEQMWTKVFKKLSARDQRSFRRRKRRVKTNHADAWRGWRRSRASERNSKQDSTAGCSARATSRALSPARHRGQALDARYDLALFDCGDQLERHRAELGERLTNKVASISSCADWRTRGTRCCGDSVDVTAREGASRDRILDALIERVRLRGRPTRRGGRTARLAGSGDGGDAVTRRAFRPSMLARPLVRASRRRTSAFAGEARATHPGQNDATAWLGTT
jgi:hypothetical protein